MEHEKTTYLTKCQSGKWWQQTTTWYPAAIVYKIFFHEIYFPHSTFRVSSKVHMSHYLSLSLSGTGWEVLFLSTGSYIIFCGEHFLVILSICDYKATSLSFEASDTANRDVSSPENYRPGDCGNIARWMVAMQRILHPEQFILSQQQRTI